MICILRSLHSQLVKHSLHNLKTNFQNSAPHKWCWPCYFYQLCDWWSISSKLVTFRPKTVVNTLCIKSSAKVKFQIAWSHTHTFEPTHCTRINTLYEWALYAFECNLKELQGKVPSVLEVCGHSACTRPLVRYIFNMIRGVACRISFVLHCPCPEVSFSYSPHPPLPSVPSSLIHM